MRVKTKVNPLKLNETRFLADVHKKEGRYVKLEDSIAGFEAILNGEVDDLSENAFSYVGSLDEAIEKGKK